MSMELKHLYVSLFEIGQNSVECLIRREDQLILTLLSIEITLLNAVSSFLYTALNLNREITVSKGKILF